MPPFDIDLESLLDDLPFAAYLCDTEGLITHFNEPAAALWGRRPKLNDAGERFCGSHRAFTPEGSPLTGEQSCMARALAEGRSFNEVEVVVERPDGSRWTVWAHATPLLDGRGGVRGAVNVMMDLTGRREAEFDRARLAAIVDSSDDAIVSKDLNGIVQSWNASAERLFGYTSDEMVGASITRLIPEERLDEEVRILARLRAGEHVDHFDTIRLRKDGSPVHVSLSISPVRDETGRIVGASKIARDITERVRTEERIRDLLDRLREADRRKDEFLAMLAHELRNPLAPLRNALDLLATEGADAGSFELVRPTLERQLTQMVRIVDDLLDVSRITSGRIRLVSGPVALGETVRHSVDTVRHELAARRHALELRLPDQEIVLQGDSARLEQVVVNLLTNAIKYTDPGGRIAVSVARSGDRAVLSVLDTGVGIAPELLPHVFDLFTQSDRSLDRSQGGLGLGLCLVKQLVGLHGGDVGVRSVLGQGSEFTVRLPLLPAVAAAAAARRAAPASAGPRRVLVVDDNRDAADSMALLLRAWKHDVRTAGDGPSALEAARSHGAEVILLDIGLPGMDGYEVARRIRATPELAGVTLVALTGYGQESDRERSRAAGFDRHLIKPASIDELRGILEGGREGSA